MDLCLLSESVRKSRYGGIKVTGSTITGSHTISLGQGGQSLSGQGGLGGSVYSNRYPGKWGDFNDTKLVVISDFFITGWTFPLSDSEITTDPYTGIHITESTITGEHNLCICEGNKGESVQSSQGNSKYPKPSYGGIYLSGATIKGDHSVSIGQGGASGSGQAGQGSHQYYSGYGGR